VSAAITGKRIAQPTVLQRGFGTLNEMPVEPVTGIGQILEAMSTLPAFRDARNLGATKSRDISRVFGNRGGLPQRCGSVGYPINSRDKGAGGRHRSYQSLHRKRPHTAGISLAVLKRRIAAWAAEHVYFVKACTRSAGYCSGVKASQAVSVAGVEPLVSNRTTSVSSAQKLRTPVVLGVTGTALTTNVELFAPPDEVAKL
jgi:hypothetical protein